MLLPSDVARLVLGYLQEEGLSATSQAFIHESPNLKEYADHTIGDGTIPACVFSVFGKGLTTILNEYVAAKTKESCPEVPAVMTSLWKKLDFTLNQIKSLQNAPAACQRTRSRIGVANLTRQRVMTVASAGAVVCSSVSETSSIISPASTSHSMLGHSTPVSYAAPHIRPAAGSSTHQQIQDVRLNTPRDSPVQVIVSEHRLNPGPMSPGRRKWDTPRKRGGAVSGSSGPGRCATAASNPSAEPQPEEAVEENFPQLVIQSARDKILGDRSLQEKLAENINKILASDPMPQTSKASSTVEADQSIDEILGLQGEIHMSDDAIHDILEQTESDPAFQALYDLFDYNKTRFTDGEPGDGDIGSTPEESATAGPASAVRPPQSDDPGTTHRDANASDTTPMQVKTKAGQEKERKTRKSTVPSLKKTVLCSSGRASRIENSSARLLVSQGEQRGASSTAVDLNRKQKASLFSNSVFDTPMDIDEPLNTSPPLVDTMEPASKDGTSTMTALSESTTAPSLRSSTAFSVPGLTSVSTVDNKQEHKQAEAFKEQPATAPFGLMIQPALLPSIQVEQNNAPITTVDLPQISCSGGSTQPVFTLSVTPESASSTSASTVTAFTAAPGSASTSATLTATPASSVSTSHTSSTSCTPVGVTLDPPTSNPTTQSKSASDSNIVSLKIIISDNQDEGGSSDPALTQAVSSISGDKIPTIYLSSPAKSPAPPGTPKAGLDEAAQAVSGLQSSEVHASPLSSRAGALMASPLTGTSQVQQNYIIQLPLDTSTPALQGATASYFLVTEPPTTDAQTRPVLLSTGVSKGQPLPVNQFGMATPTSSQGYSTGSALILPSPVKPMMLPVSVMGQNTLGKVQMVSNQLVAIPNAVPVQQAETVKPSSPSVSIKWTKLAGTEQVSKVVLPVSADKAGKQDTAKGPKHKRILCFDSSAEVQTQPAKATRAALPPATNTSTSRSVQQIEKDKTKSFTLTRPNVLSGNKPKRRVETVKCSTEPQTDGGFAKEVETLTLPPQRQTDTVKKHSRKQDHSIRNQDPQSASTSRVDASQPETLKKSESGNRSKSIDRKHSHDKDGDGAKVKDSRSLSSDSAQKSGSRKEKEENSRKEPAEKAPAKSREGRSEKRTSSQETPNVTANKENEIKGSMQEQQQSTPSSSASRDFSPPAVTQSPSNPQSKVAKAPSKTSSLAKQAAEMLNDIQGLGSPSASGKRPAASTTDPSLPRTPGSVRDQEEPADCPRTPSRQKKGKEGEGTPKHLKPPNTPDVPTCSPASEAGSENSINMAAHTLMILSRAAIARTGTPLKDSLRQEGVGEKSSASSKNSKKRKLSSPKTSPPAKKDRERKKLIDCFPHDLDVDKFLSSLHYDE